MTRWEYEIITLSDREKFRFSLNSHGREGWEVVSADYVIDPGPKVSPALEALGSGAHHTWIAVLKRPIK
jgi:hypothetical protein